MKVYITQSQFSELQGWMNRSWPDYTAIARALDGWAKTQNPLNEHYDLQRALRGEEVTICVDIGERQ